MQNSSSLMIQMVALTIVVLTVSPGISFDLWQTIRKGWKLHKTIIREKRIRQAEDRLRKYWEIDMRKFK